MFNFQYCQKIVVFSKDEQSILLCKRKGENDYDGIFSFIGGKMENTDPSFLLGLQREKNEEVGIDFKIEISTEYTTQLLFKKSSGDYMVLPHYFARHKEGDITLNEEYSEYRWVPIKDLQLFEPKVPNIPETVAKLQKLKTIISKQDLIQI